MFRERRCRACRAIAGCLAIVAAITACGGGTGLGPGEIKKREDRLRDELPIDWSDYNQGEYEAAIDNFTSTLEKADVIEGVEGVKNLVKAEAYNGIAWSLLRLQDLPGADQAFGLATQLDRTNADAWVGWAGVALARQRYADVLQFPHQALALDSDFNSATRVDSDGRLLGHDRVDERHVRLMLSEAFFQLGRYSAIDRADPNNAAAQIRLVDRSYRFQDPGQLLEAMSRLSIQLQETISESN
jgi:tetratricopeptide (TPR) repeat protein